MRYNETPCVSSGADSVSLLSTGRKGKRERKRSWSKHGDKGHTYTYMGKTVVGEKEKVKFLLTKQYLFFEFLFCWTFVIRLSAPEEKEEITAFRQRCHLFVGR